MLQAIRGTVGSWIVKILFAFLILSFAVWGIGDMFRDRGPDTTIIEVADTTITFQELETVLLRQLDRRPELLAPDNVLEAAQRRFIVAATVQQVVNDALIDAEAASLGFVPSDAVIAELVRQLPAFRDDVTGRFDRNRFLARIGQQGLTEQGYIAQLRGNIARQTVRNAAGLGAIAPEFLADRLLRHRGEVRTVETIVIARDGIADVADPTGDDLAAFLDDHPDQFRTPEYRLFSVISVSADDLIDDIAVPEADLRAAYEMRLGAFQEPEQRRFDHALLAADDRETADALAAAVRDGATLEDAVDSIAPNGGVTLVPIDLSTREDMIPDALADAAFALPDVGDVTDPVESQLGLHLLMLTEIAPEQTIPFAEVRDEIETRLRRERAVDGLYDFTADLDDALAAGGTLEEVSGQLNLTLTGTPPIAADGSAADGDAPALPAWAEIVREGFGLDAGETGFLIESDDDSYFVLRVDDIRPPRLPPLEEIRDDVAQAWIEARQAEAAAALAEEAVARLAEGADLQAVAASVGGTAADAAELRRDGSNRGSLPVGIVNEVFDLRVGEAAAAPTLDGSQAIARLTAIAGVDPADAADRIDAVRLRETNNMTQEIIDQFTAALRQRFPVEIDDEAIADLADPS